MNAVLLLGLTLAALAGAGSLFGRKRWYWLPLALVRALVRAAVSSARRL